MFECVVGWAGVGRAGGGGGRMRGRVGRGGLFVKNITMVIEARGGWAEYAFPPFPV